MGSREISQKPLTKNKHKKLADIRISLIKLFRDRNSSIAHDYSLNYLIPFRYRQRILKKGNEPNVLPSISYLALLSTHSAKIVARIALIATWILIYFGFKEQISSELPAIASYLDIIFWSVTVLLYITLAKRIWHAMRHSLRNIVLINKKSSSQIAFEITNYLAFATVACFTAIIALVLFDLSAHDAAAELADRQALALKALNQADDRHWRIQLELPNIPEVESSFLADFGGYAGTFGDFLGGILNPILTFGTLLALAITVLIQRIQLIDEKKRADESALVSNLQTFETTFFNLLNLHSATTLDLKFAPDEILLPSEEQQREQKKINAIQVENRQGAEVKGRPIFLHIMTTIRQKFDKVNRYSPVDKHITQPSQIYEIIQNKHNHVLGHYFRNLYQILSFVDQYAVHLTNGDDTEEYQARKRYTNILRAQLSAHELNILFFNCMDSIVDDGTFRALLIEYEFLEHMPIEYVYSEHELRISGSNISINSKIDQYTSLPGLSISSTGAFGRNPQFDEYLTIGKLYI